MVLLSSDSARVRSSASDVATHAANINLSLNAVKRRLSEFHLKT